MAEKNGTKIFREKSLEAVESPEVLNDYLRVTSPGVWLILAAVTALLIGGILWSIFGRINTTAQLAVASREGSSVCYVPYEIMGTIPARNTINIEGTDYALQLDTGTETVIVTEETNPYIRIAGRLNIGDLVVQVPLEAELADGVYAGEVMTESLRPISLLLK